MAQVVLDVTYSEYLGKDLLEIRRKGILALLKDFKIENPKLNLVHTVGTNQVEVSNLSVDVNKDLLKRNLGLYIGKDFKVVIK